MIHGRTDTWFTIDEFAEMIGREAKTVRNWISAGRLHVVDLYGVPLVSLAVIERMLAGAPPAPDRAAMAGKLMRRTDSRARGRKPDGSALTASATRGSM